MGQAEQVGDQQHQEDEHGGADHRDDGVPARRQPVELAGDLLDLGIGQAGDPIDRLGRVDAERHHLPADVVAGEEGGHARARIDLDRGRDRLLGRHQGGAGGIDRPGQQRT